jgi:hydroxymethylglutaryl-CoA lyase
MSGTSKLSDVELIDVSLRDGLQDESCIVPLAQKLAILGALRRANFRSIEATSFVHPSWVPQLADAEDFVTALPMGPRYSALVLNRRGFERAVKAFAGAGFPRGSYDLTFVVSASPRHAMANNNRTIEDSLAIFEDIGAAARASEISLTATIACAFGPPWDDERIEARDVAQLAHRLRTAGARRLTLADTVGLAEPEHVSVVVSAVQQKNPDTELALHLHDRIGVALQNIDAALNHGVRIFEGALAGLGGCPFVPDAPGNVDLAALDAFFTRKGITTGLDASALRDVSAVIRAALATAHPIAAASPAQSVARR